MMHHCYILEIMTSDVYEDMIDNIDIYMIQVILSQVMCCFHQRIKRLLVSLKMNL